MISIPHFDFSDDRSFGDSRSIGIATTAKVDRDQQPNQQAIRPSAKLAGTTARAVKHLPDEDCIPNQTSPTLDRYGAAIDGLANAILDRFPLAAPTLLLFVGSENNLHVDSTCSQISARLAANNLGKVLLIDSNRKGNLTNQYGLQGEPGVTNLFEKEHSWPALIRPQHFAGMDFLPAGNESWERWGASQRMRLVTAEMKQQFQFVCIAAGDAHDPNARLWTEVSDGTYLLVSLKNSNRMIAQSAVTELQTSGARLLGCVVTDFEPIP